MTRILAAWFGALMATAAATGAWAAGTASGQVVVFEPLGSSQIARHCLTRIREELTAGGFEVSSLEPGPRRDPVSLAHSMEAQVGADAVIALSGEPGKPGAELWILDRIGATPEVRRLPTSDEDRERLPEVLAVRTIELLKASALKLLVEVAVPAPEPARPAVVAPPAPSPPIVAAAPPAPRGPPLFGLEAGVSILDSVGGAGAAALPLARARGRLSARLFTRVTLAGLGSRPRIATTAGSASVMQSLALGELVVAPRPGRRWSPVFTAGAGVLHVESRGEGLSPNQGREEARWVAALDAGAGALATFGGNFSATLELHVLAAVPHPTVRFNEVAVATIGYPAILASLTMVAWL